MKKIVAAAVLLGFSMSASAAGGLGELALIKSLQGSSGVIAGLGERGGLFAFPATLQGLPVVLYSGAFSFTTGLPILRSTALPGLFDAALLATRNNP